MSAFIVMILGAFLSAAMIPVVAVLMAVLGWVDPFQIGNYQFSKYSIKKIKED